MTTHSAPNAVTSVIILGGGSAGWMTAALLSRLFKQSLKITLVESDAVGTIGVGEASIPPLTLFNQALGIDEAEFLRQTHGSIKLGIEFQGWGDNHSRYMHAFGPIGKDLGLIPFHQLWLTRYLSGAPCGELWDYSFNHQAAKAHKFEPMATISGTPLLGLTHAYHFDAGLYGGFLKDYSTARGVVQVIGHVANVTLYDDAAVNSQFPKANSQASDSGHQAQAGVDLNPKHEPRIESITLSNGDILRADLFIDCTGMQALLIEGALKAGFDDYSDLLPCDRAIAVPCERAEPLLPYTQSIAFEAGWRWRIPLTHRTGNGVVYSSKYMSDEAAEAFLLNSLDGKPLAKPNRIRFKTGRRQQQWRGNCISIGLSSGFLEPLESTSIHLVQSALLRLVRYFPSGEHYQQCRDAFNQESKQEFEDIRDFIVLHYALNRRDEPFWRQQAALSLPDNLRERMALFQENGSLVRRTDELFSPLAWQQVFIGQGLIPTAASPLCHTVTGADIDDYLNSIRKIQQQAVTKLPLHSHYLTALAQQRIR